MLSNSDPDERARRALERAFFPVLDHFFKAHAGFRLRLLPYHRVCHSSDAREQARDVHSFLHLNLGGHQPVLRAGDCFMLPGWCKRYKESTLQSLRKVLKDDDPRDLASLRARAVLKLDETIGLHEKAARTGLIGVYFSVSSVRGERLADEHSADEIAARPPPLHVWNFCVLAKRDMVQKLGLVERLRGNEGAQELEAFGEYVTAPVALGRGEFQYQVFAVTAEAQADARSKPASGKPPKARASQSTSSASSLAPVRRRATLAAPNNKTPPRAPRPTKAPSSGQPMPKRLPPGDLKLRANAQMMKLRRQALNKKYRRICAVH